LARQTVPVGLHVSRPLQGTRGFLTSASACPVALPARRLDSRAPGGFATPRALPNRWQSPPRAQAGAPQRLAGRHRGFASFATGLGRRPSALPPGRAEGRRARANRGHLLGRLVTVGRPDYSPSPADGARGKGTGFPQAEKGPAAPGCQPRGRLATWKHLPGKRLTATCQLGTHASAPGPVKADRIGRACRPGRPAPGRRPAVTSRLVTVDRARLALPDNALRPRRIPAAHPATGRGQGSRRVNLICFLDNARPAGPLSSPVAVARPGSRAGEGDAPDREPDWDSVDARKKPRGPQSGSRERHWSGLPDSAQAAQREAPPGPLSQAAPGIQARSQAPGPAPNPISP
jgi:hypothetical protein